MSTFNQKKEQPKQGNNILSAIINGLGVYKLGEGEPLLLFPYPHGSTFTSISESPLCNILVSIGRTVITFDPPGAYKSKRKADYSLEEMLNCGEEALNYFEVKEPVGVVGHSMGGFCAVAFAVKKKNWVKKLLVICGNSGYSDVSNQWFKSKFIKGKDFIKLTYYGFKEIVGLGSMENHKKMNNLLDYHLLENKGFYEPRIINNGDWRRPAPARDRWMNTVRKENFSEYLYDIDVEVFIISGRNDILSAEKTNEKMHEKIRKSKIEYFQKSRHFPFIEEKEKFIKVVDGFLNSK